MAKNIRQEVRTDSLHALKPKDANMEFTAYNTMAKQENYFHLVDVTISQYEEYKFKNRKKKKREKH